MEKKILEVCAAVAFHDGRMLNATRRPGGALAGYWEFPGGKCSCGETLEACIARELEEELGLNVLASTEILALRYEYPEKIVNLHFMMCELGNAEAAIPREGQTVGWHTPEELPTLEFAPADRLFLDIAAAGAQELQDVHIVNGELLQKLSSWLTSRSAR